VKDKKFKLLKKKMPANEASIVIARLQGEAYDRQIMYRNIAIGTGVIGAIYLISKVR
jgi:hypothetical protein